MIKVNHNNVKVVAGPPAEKYVFFSKFLIMKNTKQQEPFPPQVSLSPRQTRKTCLVFPSSDLKSSTYPSPGVCTDGGIDSGQGTAKSNF